MDKMNRENYSGYSEGMFPPGFDPNELDGRAEDVKETDLSEEQERAIGNKAMNIPEQGQAQEPIGAVSNKIDSPAQEIAPVDQETMAKIRTADRLNNETMKAVDEAVDSFKKDGDAASFYEKARRYMEANLDNSYSRKLGGQ